MIDLVVTYLHDWTPEQPKRWQDDAACKGLHDLFILSKGVNVSDEAKELCASCPVLEECAEWSLNTTQRVYGFVAGMTERERRRQRKARRRAA